MNATGDQLYSPPPAINDGSFIVETTPSIEPLVTAIMLDQIAGGRRDLAMQMPEVDQVTVFSGGGAIAQARCQQMMTHATDHSHKLKFVSLGEGISTAPLSLELLATWMPSQEAATKMPWWVIRHLQSGRPTPNFFRSLGRFRSTMSKGKSRGLLILTTDAAEGCQGLEDMADEYLVANECEDGLKATKCISFHCPTSAAFSPFDPTKVMCVVSPTLNGMRFRFEPFISAELIVRVMARLRGTDRTYEEIGKLVKLDKSTVLRRLRGVPIRPFDENPQWLEAVKDHFGSEGG